MASKPKDSKVRRSKSTKRRKASSPSEVSIDKIRVTEEYAQNEPKLAAVLDEAVFVLKDRLNASDIKLHNIERRVKSLESLIAKCERDGRVDPFNTIHDIAGARVICLFKDDLEKIEKIISDSFEVLETDDKRLGGEAPLGYLSIHYVCRIPEHYKGPRYDQTKGITFEIQVRTLCMHCWAAVSHYLDYKGDWDVPRDLRMALNALGGLFYVADNEFQQFFFARQQSLARAASGTENPKNINEDINLDTVTLYLQNKFPHRHHGTKEQISSFVYELKTAGFGQLAEVDQEITRATEALAEAERNPGPGITRHEDPNVPFSFGSLAAARFSLAMASDKYNLIRQYDREKLFGTSALGFVRPLKE